MRLAAKALLIVSVVGVGTLYAQTGNSVSVYAAGAPTGTCSAVMYDTDTNTGDFYNCVNSAWHKVSSGSSALPSGMIFVIASGTCPVGSSETTALNGKMLRGTLAANGDVGTVGGSATITPAGTVSTPTFTGTANQSTSAVTAGTPSGTVSQPTFTGSALATHTHTFTGTLATAASTTASPKLVTANTSTGVAPQLTATGTNAAITAGTPAGTVSQPSFTGSALGTHSHTITPAGAISQPTFTGNAIDPSPSYVKVIFCSAN